jgi:hypothetical protein
VGGGGGGGGGGKQPVEFFVQGLSQTYEECQATDFNQVMKKVAQAYEVTPGELSSGQYTMQIETDYSDWKDLKSFNQLKEACNQDGDEFGGATIRIKELAQDDEDDELDKYGDDEPKDDEDWEGSDDEDLYGEKDHLMGGGGNEGMKEAINDLIEALKGDGWRLPESDEFLLPDEFKLRKENGSEEMSARALVLKYAKNLPDLQDQLIMKFGSLDHIVQCLQFGFLWESKKEPDESE